MKADFYPNPYGGWYYNLIDDEGGIHGTYYTLSYRAALRHCRRLARKLKYNARRKPHTVEITERPLRHVAF